MKIKYAVTMLLAAGGLLSACEKTETPALNSGAEIVSLTFSGDHIASQPTLSGEREYTLTVEKAISENEKKAMTFAVEVSKGATYLPADNKLDLSGGPAQITVKSEDGKTTTVYTVKSKTLLNGEAAITSLTFSGDHIASQPVVSGENEYTFSVYRIIPEADTKTMTFATEVSEGATCLPADNLLDLSGGSAQITVKSEDGETTTVYTVKMELVAKTASILLNLDVWENETVIGQKVDGYVPVAPVISIGAYPTWGTSNIGGAFATSLASGGVQFEVLVREEQAPASRNGSAVKICTMDTKGIDMGFFGKVPKVTSGSLFSGYFELNMTSPLKSTNFGVQFDKKPLSLSGYYKYTAGTDYYESQDNIATPVLNNEKKDKCAINVVLYEIASESDAYITGENTYTDSRIVAIKRFSSEGAAEYTKFDIELDYTQEYDPSKLYRLAIIASSSIDGDSFSGAPGSELFLDDLELVYEVLE